jgi:hypothetical protein
VAEDAMSLRGMQWHLRFNASREEREDANGSSSPSPSHPSRLRVEDRRPNTSYPLPSAPITTVVGKLRTP